MLKIPFQLQSTGFFFLIPKKSFFAFEFLLFYCIIRMIELSNFAKCGPHCDPLCANTRFRVIRANAFPFSRCAPVLKNFYFTKKYLGQIPISIQKFREKIPNPCLLGNSNEKVQLKMSQPQYCLCTFVLTPLVLTYLIDDCSKF